MKKWGNESSNWNIEEAKEFKEKCFQCKDKIRKTQVYCEVEGVYFHKGCYLNKVTKEV